LSWIRHPASDAPGDEGAESVELVEEAEEMEDLSPWLDLLEDIELAADEPVSSLCSSWVVIRADSPECRILE
jgi:hypothetical protein